VSTSIMSKNSSQAGEINYPVLFDLERENSGSAYSSGYRSTAIPVLMAAQQDGVTNSSPTSQIYPQLIKSNFMDFEGLLSELFITQSSLS